MLLPSNSTPGIPPASLSSFLRVKPSLAGAVLADYDAHFRNPFFESEQDTADNVNLDSLAAAAVLLARALHQLAAANGSAPLKVCGCLLLIRCNFRALLEGSRPGQWCNPLFMPTRTPSTMQAVALNQCVAVLLV